MRLRECVVNSIFFLIKGMRFGQSNENVLEALYPQVFEVVAVNLQVSPAKRAVMVSPEILWMDAMLLPGGV
jgi:hypothetical protein